MMSSERRRHQLYEEARTVFSDQSADELMGYLPPVGWADVATKADLGIIRNEMDAMRAELRGEIAELRGEMAAFRSELRGEMATFRSEILGQMDASRSELRGEMATFRAEIQGEMRTELAVMFDRMRVWTIGTMFTLTALVTAIVFGASRLGR